MQKHERLIKSFFEAYGARMNRAIADPKRTDLSNMRTAFADYFVGAGPSGVAGGKNGLLFRFMLPRGISYYRKIGTRAMNVTNVRVTDLDEYHAMARVDWSARYKNGQEIEFSNTYLLQVRDGRPKIFAWVTGDEQQALKDAGVIE